MSRITDQIHTILLGDAVSHSLSKEALERMLGEIDGLKMAVEDLTEEADTQAKNVKELNEILASARDANSKLLVENQKAIGREDGLLKREKACLVLEVRNEFEKQRGDEHYQTINKIFDNRIVRENTTSSYPVKEVQTTHTDSQGYGASTFENHTQVTETKTSALEEK